VDDHADNRPPAEHLISGTPFVIDAPMAIALVQVELEIRLAEYLVEYASRGDHEDDPEEYLARARLSAANAKGHIDTVVRQAQKDNHWRSVIRTLGPLLDALERRLDAIRYRVHTAFLHHLDWTDELDIGNGSVAGRIVRITTHSGPDEQVSLNVTRHHESIHGGSTDSAA